MQKMYGRTRQMQGGRMIAEITSQRLLTLVRAALHDTVPDENLFIHINGKEWNELFELLARQGIMAMTFDKAMLLPSELYPPKTLKLRWIASVEAVKEGFRHRLKTAEELSAAFRENNIRMLLFKGIALARLYPFPFYREFGDIDIFCTGNAAESNALLKSISKQQGGKTRKKHTEFYYRGILIENHHTFLDKKSFYKGKYLEQRLTAIMMESGILDNSRPQDETLIFPPPDFDALFIMLHLLGHWTSKILLRQLCDLTVLFTAYKGQIDFSAYRDALQKSGLLKLADAFTALSVKYLGLNPEYAPPHDSDLSLENRIWNDILNHDFLPKDKRSLHNIFIYKIGLLQSRRWKDEMVYPNQFAKKVFCSAIHHLRHPEVIRKIK